MKKTPFGAFLTPALTGRPPAEIRIEVTVQRKSLSRKRSNNFAELKTEGHSELRELKSEVGSCTDRIRVLKGGEGESLAVRGQTML